MHELSLLADLLRQIESIANEHRAQHVRCVTVRLGALSQISPGHLREHFTDGTRGTVAEGSQLMIEMSEDIHDEHAGDILLESVEVDE
mgnify:CR=1 FL=1